MYLSMEKNSMVKFEQKPDNSCKNFIKINKY